MFPLFSGSMFTNTIARIFLRKVWRNFSIYNTMNFVLFLKPPQIESKTIHHIFTSRFGRQKFICFVSQTLKVLKVLKWNFYGFSHAVRKTRTFGVFHTSKTIDGLNLRKPFWAFSYSPRDKTFMGFPYE